MSEETQAPKEPISVYDHLVYLLDQMAGISWQRLGLQPDMVTGTLAADLDEAKVAIDLSAYLAGIVEPKLGDEDRRRVQSLVRDLRLNYVQRRQDSGG